MNLQEFAALKVGDVVRNHMTQSAGVVSRCVDAGVWLYWLPGGPENARLYAAQSTAWFHWSKDESCPGLENCTRDDCKRAEQCLGGSTDDYSKWAGVP